MQKYDIAAYVWPAYTGDEPRARMFWPEGFGEWQSVKSAAAKYSGHSWPRRPLWGYVNEADPRVMEMEIDAAVEHGVNVFIYDWYWYDRRPFLENCLNDGFLKARNSEKMKFYIMWANHDANNLWDMRLSQSAENVIWGGAVGLPEFKAVCARLIGMYFKRPNYYCIGGAPVFMVYDIQNLISGLGGMAQARSALEWFRGETAKAGFPDLHLQLAARGAVSSNLSGVDGGAGGIPSAGECARLGFQSATHYQFCHFADMDCDYLDILKRAEQEWEAFSGAGSLPYFPHVSVGWDSNPRYRDFKPGVVRNNGPENFGKALALAKKYADSRPSQPALITVNSWNEWTEGSYLEPDDLHGYGYLQAIKDAVLLEGAK
ncbi:MAG: glycoside hydrolase family 99-like domain-containing protein [Clostridiales bacterium]|jgi:hypothetical protein|nr:glycoside hydrolase family 99-like domain-containing protein [Clostridiales bacterium]